MFNLLKLFGMFQSVDDVISSFTKSINKLSALADKHAVKADNFAELADTHKLENIKALTIAKNLTKLIS